MMIRNKSKNCVTCKQSLIINYREKENALAVANTTIKQQKSQAEQALNELKAEVERNSNKLYDDMKNQVRFRRKKKLKNFRFFKFFYIYYLDD